jgi:poly(3-hydroxybutyrate) depolymerase
MHQRHYDVEGAGHYGIFSGRRWREKVCPVVKAFIAQYEASPIGSAAPATARRSPARPTVRAPKAARAGAASAGTAATRKSGPKTGRRTRAASARG